MKKRVEKPKTKSAVKKNGTARKELPRKELPRHAAEASVSPNNDSLRSLLKGAHTHRVCDR